jgi:hypothetical protein
VHELRHVPEIDERFEEALAREVTRLRVHARPRARDARELLAHPELARDLERLFRREHRAKRAREARPRLVRRFDALEQCQRAREVLGPASARRDREDEPTHGIGRSFGAHARQTCTAARDAEKGAAANPPAANSRADLVETRAHPA